MAAQYYTRLRAIEETQEGERGGGCGRRDDGRCGLRSNENM